MACALHTLHRGDRGWQQAACAGLDQRALETDLDGASRALLLSQAGPGGSLALTALPTREEFTLQDDTFRCVLLRRLKPVRWRACSLERAADLNLGLPLTDGRRLELVAHGLPAFGGVQVAADVTLVSPLRRDGSSRYRADHEPGLVLRAAAERKRWVTYPEFQRARRCRLTVLALEVGGRWGEERPSSTASRRARTWQVSARPSVARMGLVAALLPANVIANHAPLARLDFGFAQTQLKLLAHLLAVIKELRAIIRNRNSLTFAFLSRALPACGPFGGCLLSDTAAAPRPWVKAAGICNKGPRNAL